MEGGNTMNITSARVQDTIMPDEQPSTIKAVIDGQELSVPMDLNNRHYAEIMRQVDAGTLTIESQP